MTSRLLSTLSAALLAAGGLALLFAADAILPRLLGTAGALPRLALGHDAAAGITWLGQLLGAAWLGLAWLNWFSRGTVMGGIYGRPVVMPNLILYFVSALVLLRAMTRADHPLTLLWLLVPATGLAASYGWLLYRGPFAADDAR